MDDKKLRKVIGSRALQRRKELKLSQKYIAEKLGVDTSTVLRYEKGVSDNTKFYILEGLANALDVSVDWLKGETDDMHAQSSDTLELQIGDMTDTILKNFPKDLSDDEETFCKNILLLMLKEYDAFTKSFNQAVKNYGYGNDNSSLAETIGFESEEEFNSMMFTREINHTVSTFNEIIDILSGYAKNPSVAQSRLNNLLNFYKNS